MPKGVGRLATYQGSLEFLGLLLPLVIVLETFSLVFNLELLRQGNEPVNSVVPLLVGLSPLWHSVAKLLEKVSERLSI